MFGMPTITLHLPQKRPVTVTAMELDRAITRYLPNSPNGLRSKLGPKPNPELDSISEVSALLILLARFNEDGNGPAITTDESPEGNLTPVDRSSYELVALRDRIGLLSNEGAHEALQ